MALSIGLGKDSPKRIIAGIKHVLAASRDFGHCFLTESQILDQVQELLELDLSDRLPGFLSQMEQDNLLKVGERIFRQGDRVIHRRNNYNLGVFNGDIGTIQEIDNRELTCTVAFFPDNRQVLYQKEDIFELDLAYAVTIHKSQGSEFEIVIIAVLTQHFKMLFRNLIYTALTRARKYAFFVGTRKALAMAVKNQDTSQRQTALKELIATAAF